jgi:hypothetical protein
MAFKVNKKEETRVLTTKFPASDFVSSGSTLLDVHVTGKRGAGFKKGTYVLFVGDSESGKTCTAVTCLAEAARNPAFDDYSLILDDVEYGMLADLDQYFGQTLSQRIQAPNDGNCSESLDECYDNIENALDHGPCIYVVDSMDVLDAKDDQKKAEEDKKARKAGMAKAKMNSTRLRRIVNKIKKTGSILIIISQTRDNVGFGFETKTRAGGRALKFYAHLEIWTSIVKKLKKKSRLSKQVKEKDREIGAITQLQVKKNRYYGWKGTVQIPFLRGYGIDDIGSCIDYIVGEGYWTRNTKGIVASELNMVESRDNLIKAVEESEKKSAKLRKIVKRVRDEVELLTLAHRKPRYE